MENKQDEFVGLPNWVTFLAIDKNGDLWGFDDRPKISSSFWYSDTAEKGVFIRECRNYSGYWENSLIERKI